MKPSKLAATVTFAAAINLTLLSEAMAYIDPGTGTMILQVAGAMIAAGLFYLRSIRLWIADKLGFARGQRPAGAQSASSESPTDEPSDD